MEYTSSISLLKLRTRLFDIFLSLLILGCTSYVFYDFDKNLNDIAEGLSRHLVSY